MKDDDIPEVLWGVAKIFTWVTLKGGSTEPLEPPPGYEYVKLQLYRVMNNLLFVLQMSLLLCVFVYTKLFCNGARPQMAYFPLWTLIDVSNMITISTTQQTTYFIVELI